MRAAVARPQWSKTIFGEQLRDVTTIGSDHSPSPPEMKEQKTSSSVGRYLRLPALVAAADRRARQDLAGTRSTSLTSSGVAERFQDSRKRRPGVGQDADLTLVDRNAKETVRGDALHYRHRHSPYVGRKLRGRIVRTILRGQTIFENGSLGALPAGQLVRPSIASIILKPIAALQPNEIEKSARR